MDFSHLAFYSRELTLEDILRKPQRVPERSMYKFAYGRETNLEQALVLIDKPALEELVEVFKFVKRRGRFMEAGSERHQEMEGLFEEMAAMDAAGDAVDVAGGAADAAGGGDDAFANSPIAP